MGGWVVVVVSTGLFPTVSRRGSSPFFGFLSLLFFNFKYKSRPHLSGPKIHKSLFLPLRSKTTHLVRCKSFFFLFGNYSLRISFTMKIESILTLHDRVSRP
ncbi:hypothetical protein AA313_de0200903 [Arthrobotrys entomopaga]|nr:hypothetical protein AA313_de0200903 [Arthrobotrys entomopaga]